MKKLLSVLFGLLAGSVVAQEPLSSQRFLPIESLAPSLWREAQNPATLHSSGLRNYAMTSFGGMNEFGGLKRPQEPLERGVYGFNAEGASAIAEWLAAGSFAYRRVNDKAVQWLAAENAYDGNPFLLADSVGGDWFRDEVSLSAALGSPEWFGRIALGVQATYAVRQGARRNDARPLYRSRRIDFKPSLAIRVIDSHRLAVAPKWHWRKEENEFAFFTTQSDWRLYFLRGLGTFNQTTVSSAERNATGDFKGAELGYEGGASQWRWSASAEWLTGTTDVIDGVAIASFAGRVISNIESLRFAMRRASTAISAEVRLSRFKRDERGADDFDASLASASPEPDFLAVNVIDQETIEAFSAELWLGEDRASAPLRLFASVGRRTLFRRDIIAETDWQTRLQTLQLGALSTASLFGAQVFSGATAAFSSSRDNRYRAERPTQLTPILVRPDFLAMSAERRFVSLLLGVETTAIWIRAASLRTVLSLACADSPARFDDGETIGLRRSLSLELQLLY